MDRLDSASRIGARTDPAHPSASLSWCHLAAAPGLLETRDAATQGLHQDGLLSSRMVYPFALLDLSVQTALTGSGGAELTRSPPASANHNEKAAWGRFLIYSQGVGR